MNLTKEEIKKISDLYGIGNFKESKYISGGMINYNFSVKTDKGKFLVKKLGYKLNSWIMNKKELEFGVLEYLRKNKYPYEIPNFLKNKNGRYVSKIGRTLFEVHPWIQGRKRVRLNTSQFKEMVKALAIYHRMIKKYKIPKKFGWSDDGSWMLKKYVELRKVKPKNKVDKLMLDNLDKYEVLLKEVLKINLQVDKLIAHSDFSVQNLLWKGDKIIGVLDFENVMRRPKLFDICYLWKEGESRKRLLIKTYRKYNSLSRKEEKNFLVHKLLHTCNMFWWSYLGMKKKPELKYQWIRRTLKYKKMYTKMWKQAKH